MIKASDSNKAFCDQFRQNLADSMDKGYGDCTIVRKNAIYSVTADSDLIRTVESKYELLLPAQICFFPLSIYRFQQVQVKVKTSGG